MRSKTHRFVYLTVLVLLLLFIYYFSERSETAYESIRTRTLEKDGFCVLQNDIFVNTQNMPNYELREAILDKLPEGYQFVDYTYKIQNVALSTFHRDVTSSQHIYKTIHPVYTLILYKSGGELLSLCPSSNKTYPFVWSRILNITGNPGTAFLFNCDVLHAGCTNQCKKRDVIQYKICHKDDLYKLSHLRGVRASKTDICKITTYDKCLRKMSYFLEFPVNYMFYPLMIKRENTDSIVGKLQSYIPINYYNNV